MATRPNKVAQKQTAEEKAAEKPASRIPDSAPRPQDHKIAKADVVKDTDAVTFEVDDKTFTMVDDAFDQAQDIDFVERLGDGNVIWAMRQLLGYKEWTRLKEHLRETTDGKYVPFDDRVNTIWEDMMKALKAKNS